MGSYILYQNIQNMPQASYIQDAINEKTSTKHFQV